MGCTGCERVLVGCERVLVGCERMLVGCERMLVGCERMLVGCERMLVGCERMLVGCERVLVWQKSIHRAKQDDMLWHMEGMKQDFGCKNSGRPLLCTASRVLPP
jgi:hypothetical protein